MQRSRLKLSVIFLLLVLNLVLLGCVVYRHHQAQAYEALAQEQILAYLEEQGIAVDSSLIPWTSTLSRQSDRLEDALLPGEALPDGVLSEACRVEESQSTITLLMALAQALAESGWSGSEILSITEGYHYHEEQGTATLTPAWQMETDAGTVYFSCADGTLF